MLRDLVDEAFEVGEVQQRAGGLEVGLDQQPLDLLLALDARAALGVASLPKGADVEAEAIMAL